MNPHVTQPGQRSVVAEVRANALWAAIAAALFLYYGFNYIEPATTDSMWKIAQHILIWTLKIGGIVFAIVALVCFLGFIWGLLLDALFSILAGLGLVITGVMQFADEGMGTLLQIIFGVVFLAAGKRLWNEYHTLSLLTKKAAALPGDDRDLPPPRDTPVPAPIGPPPDTLGPAHAEPDNEWDENIRDNSPPPPEGFLASFADEKDDLEKDDAEDDDSPDDDDRR